MSILGKVIKSSNSCFLVLDLFVLFFVKGSFFSFNPYLDMDIEDEVLKVKMTK